MKNILITGGEGYIARNLARLFRENTDHCVYNPPKKDLDLLNPNQIKTIIDLFGPDVIIHAAIKGGTIENVDTLQDTADNIAMYENLLSFAPEEVAIFNIGSGAEFDRKDDIDCALEDDLDKSYPIDPYGLAKNIIARKTLQDTHGSIFRLFGCFNHDEEPFRFIKKSILNIKEGTPITIHQNRLMDFFYIDDVFTIINKHIPTDPYIGRYHLNLVYEDKYSLLDMAFMIIRATGEKDHMVIIEDEGMGKAYTGDGMKLKNSLRLNDFKLIGLEEGIVRTCKKLL
jgi:nucleoside-diphosphate-sugar epimerase